MKKLALILALASQCFAAQWSTGYWSPGFISIANTQWTGLTGAIYVAAQVKSDGSLDLALHGFSTYAPGFVSAAHAHSAEAFFTLQADLASDFNGAIEDHLALLVTNILAAVNLYGFDGVDIDWEPESDFGSNPDAADMTAFATALKTALGTKILTMAPAVNQRTYWSTHYTLVDRLNVQTYDNTGTFFWPTNGLWFNSALYGVEGVYSVDQMRTDWTGAGIPASKIGIGLAFYGHQWSGGVLASDATKGINGPRQIWSMGNAPGSNTEVEFKDVAPLVNNGTWAFTWDTAAKVPYLSKTAALPANYGYLTYDDPQSIYLKARYAIDNSLGGWIIWNLAFDFMSGAPKTHPLLDAVNLAVTNGTGGTGGSGPITISGSVTIK